MFYRRLSVVLQDIMEVIIHYHHFESSITGELQKGWKYCFQQWYKNYYQCMGSIHQVTWSWFVKIHKIYGINFITSHKRTTWYWMLKFLKITFFGTGCFSLKNTLGMGLIVIVLHLSQLIKKSCTWSINKLFHYQSVFFLPSKYIHVRT